MKALFFFSINLFFTTFLMAEGGTGGDNLGGNNKEIVIADVNFWVTAPDGDGMVHTIGFVENKSLTQHYKVRLKVIYLDAKGAPINVEGWLSEYKKEVGGSNTNSTPGDIATIETVMVEKGKKSYFHQFRSVSKISGDVKSVKIEIERIDKCGKEYSMLLTNVTSKADVETVTIWDGTKKTYDHGMRIKGTMKNADAATATIPKIAIVLIGEDGKIWGDKVVDCTFSGLSSVKLSKYDSMDGGDSIDFDILCEHPQIDLNGKIVKVAKVEIFAYKEISYF